MKLYFVKIISIIILLAILPYFFNSCASLSHNEKVDILVPSIGIGVPLSVLILFITGKNNKNKKIEAEQRKIQHEEAEKKRLIEAEQRKVQQEEAEKKRLLEAEQRRIELQEAQIEADKMASITFDKRNYIKIASNDSRLTLNNDYPIVRYFEIEGYIEKSNNNILIKNKHNDSSGTIFTGNLNNENVFPKDWDITYFYTIKFTQLGRNNYRIDQITYKGRYDLWTEEYESIDLFNLKMSEGSRISSPSNPFEAIFFLSQMGKFRSEAIFGYRSDQEIIVYSLDKSISISMTWEERVNVPERSDRKIRIWYERDYYISGNSMVRYYKVDRIEY